MTIDGVIPAEQPDGQPPTTEPTEAPDPTQDPDNVETAEDDQQSDPALADSTTTD